jgi:hypothetical protein
MAAPPKKPAPTPASTSTKVWVWVTVVVIVGLCCWAVWPSMGDNSTVVEKPTEAEQQVVVANLARAATAHGICYGYRLEDGSRAVTVGSNLGVGKAVAENSTACPKYVEVRGSVRYYSSSSDLEDYATWSFRSTGIGSISGLTSTDLDRIGASATRLLNDPAAAILVAADALPLLAREAGLVTGDVPAPTAPAAAVPLAKSGSDFWRDRGTLMLVTGGFLLVAVAALLTGIFKGRKALPDGAGPIVPPAKSGGGKT